MNNIKIPVDEKIIAKNSKRNIKVTDGKEIIDNAILNALQLASHKSKLKSNELAPPPNNLHYHDQAPSAIDELKNMMNKYKFNVSLKRAARKQLAHESFDYFDKMEMIVENKCFQVEPLRLIYQNYIDRTAVDAVNIDSTARIEGEKILNQLKNLNDSLYIDKYNQFELYQRIQAHLKETVYQVGKVAKEVKR